MATTKTAPKTSPKAISAPVAPEEKVTAPETAPVIQDDDTPPVAPNIADFLQYGPDAGEKFMEAYTNWKESMAEWNIKNGKRVFEKTAFNMEKIIPYMEANNIQAFTLRLIPARVGVLNSETGKIENHPTKVEVKYHGQATISTEGKKVFGPAPIKYRIGNVEWTGRGLYPAELVKALASVTGLSELQVKAAQNADNPNHKKVVEILNKYRVTG